MPSYLCVYCILSQPLSISPLEQAASWTAVATTAHFTFTQLNEEGVVVAPMLET